MKIENIIVLNWSEDSAVKIRAVHLVTLWKKGTFLEYLEILTQCERGDKVESLMMKTQTDWKRMTHRICLQFTSRRVASKHIVIFANSLCLHGPKASNVEQIFFSSVFLYMKGL